MNFMILTTEWLELRWQQQFPIRANRALDRLWFRYNPPRTEWWVKTAQWFIRCGKQIAGNYRYWRYVRRP